MSPSTWRRALVLGGIRSGKSEFAEALVSSARPLTYIATARRDDTDDAWTARIERHRGRRPDGWTTAEVGDDPSRLPDVLTAAGPDDTLLVDDVGGWIAAILADVTEVTATDGAVGAAADRLATAVRGCSARLVLVSPEVGLSVVPATAAGVTFADALGATNRAIANECDAVVLVIAGNAVPVKGAL
jgi:adenosyl cobinamide kinase/adenosyl cobinamide phosphate guanylyltransferase